MTDICPVPVVTRAVAEVIVDLAMSDIRARVRNGLDRRAWPEEVTAFVGACIAMCDTPPVVSQGVSQPAAPSWLPGAYDVADTAVLWGVTPQYVRRVAARASGEGHATRDGRCWLLEPGWVDRETERRRVH